MSDFEPEDDRPTNCLEGMECPGCGQYESFFITGWDRTGQRELEVSDDGCDAVGDFEYNGDSPCRCEECGFAGTVADFEEK